MITYVKPLKKIRTARVVVAGVRWRIFWDNFHMVIGHTTNKEVTEYVHDITMEKYEVFIWDVMHVLKQGGCEYLNPEQLLTRRHFINDKTLSVAIDNHWCRMATIPEIIWDGAMPNTMAKSIPNVPLWNIYSDGGNTYTYLPVDHTVEGYFPEDLLMQITSHQIIDLIRDKNNKQAQINKISDIYETYQRALESV